MRTLCPCFRQIVADSPKSSHARYGLGYAYFGIGKYDDAEEELERAIKLDPGDYGALYLLGEICERQERGHEAEHYYEAALQRNPAFAPALSRLRLMKGAPEYVAPAAPRKNDRGQQQPVQEGPGALVQGRTNFSSFSEFVSLLELDAAPISQKIVRLIHKTERDVRPRMLPWLMPSLARMLVVFILAIFCFALMQALYPAAPAGTMIAIGVGEPIGAQMRQQMAAEQQANESRSRAHQMRYTAYQNKVHVLEALVSAG